MLALATCLAGCRSANTRDPRAETTAAPEAPHTRVASSRSSAEEAPPRPALLDPSIYAAAASASASAEPRTSPIASASGAPPASPRRYRVAAMGDSLTDPRSHGGKYLSFLREQCPKSHFVSHGKGGEMVNQMRRRFERDVFEVPAASGEAPYTDVVVFGGVNDVYSDLTAGRTPEKIQADLSEMYRSARARGLRVIALTIAPWGGFRKYYNERRGEATERVNAWIRAQREAGTVDVVVDAYALLSCGDPARLCPEYARPFKDGLHFGPEGHARLGRALLEAAFRDCR